MEVRGWEGCWGRVVVVVVVENSCCFFAAQRPSIMQCISETDLLGKFDDLNRSAWKMCRTATLV